MEQFAVTISRGYGSGGREIGKRLSEKLGVDFYDRQLLRLASDESGINEALFGQADETLKNTSLFKIASRLYNGEVIPPDREDFVSNENLFNYQAKVMLELARREPCVIIGRCANFVLRDMPYVLRVYVHAPIEYCMERLRPDFSISDSELRRKIRDTDKRRAAYYRYFTGSDWNNAADYDLCLNSADLGMEKCVELIVAYLKIKLSVAAQKDANLSG